MRLRRLAVIGALAIIVGIVAIGYFFLGFYTVAASVDDPKIVAWALPKVRDASVDRQSAGLKPPMSLYDQAVIQACGAPFPERRALDFSPAPAVSCTTLSPEPS